MNSAPIDTITVGADVGGPDAHEATNECILELRKLLRRGCPGPYSSVIKEFAIVLRVDGSVKAWNKTGIDFFALKRKNSCATIDIFVPRTVWLDQGLRAFRQFLAEQMRCAIEEILRHVKKRKIDVSEMQLVGDLEAVLAEFVV